MIPASEATSAPPLHVTRWFNTANALSLANLRGRVVVIEAFQMLCPGCVSHGLPQAQCVRAIFPNEEVSVLGLHTVFEHHAAMGTVALEAFLHEYRITFPVGVDAPHEDGGAPMTMRAWGQRGTPTLWLLDRQGRVRAEHFGAVHDMAVGAQIAALLAEPDERGAGAERFGAGTDANGPVCRPTSKVEGQAA